MRYDLYVMLGFVLNVMHVCLGKVTYFWARKGTDINSVTSIVNYLGTCYVYTVCDGFGSIKTQILFFLMNLMFVVVKVKFSSTLGRNLANHVRNNNVKNEPCKLALENPGPDPSKRENPCALFQSIYNKSPSCLFALLYIR